MAFESLIIALITLSPPILFIYLYAGEHEREFMHNKMMVYMAMGIILGTIFWLLEVMTYGNILVLMASLYFDVLPYLLFIALFEELIKSIILNRKNRQGKRDTVWYGAAMGFVIGGIMSAEMMYQSLLIFPNLPEIYVYFFALSVSFSAMHGSTGALIGYGSYTNRSWKHLFRAYLIHILFILIFFLGLSAPVLVVVLVLYSMFNLVRVYWMISE